MKNKERINESHENETTCKRFTLAQTHTHTRNDIYNTDTYIGRRTPTCQPTLNFDNTCSKVYGDNIKRVYF